MSSSSMVPEPFDDDEDEEDDDDEEYEEVAPPTVSGACGDGPSERERRRGRIQG